MRKRCCIFLLFCCILLGTVSFAARTARADKVHVHSYGILVSRVEPTCEEDGYVEYKCNKCDNVKRTVFPKTGHSWVVLSETEPVCVYQGWREIGCENKDCDAYRRETFGVAPRKDHDYRVIDVIPADCEYPMQIIKRCNYCKEEISEPQGEALGHDLYDVVVEPTCTKEGSKLVACHRCNYFKEETIPMKEHKYKITSIKRDKGEFSPGMKERLQNRL